MRPLEILASIWRRWVVVLACIIVCGGVAYGYSKLTTKIYRATSVISVTAAKFDYGNGLAAQQLIANYALQMHGEDLLTQLDQKLQLDMSPAKLNSMIQATPDNLTLTITLNVDDIDAQRAADIANGLTALFVAHIQEVNQANLNPDIDINVLQRATTPTAPNRPNTKINTLAGVLLGLMLGLGAAYALEVWDDRLRSERDVELALGLPLLGSVPHIAGMVGVQRAEAPPDASPSSTAAYTKSLR